MTPQSASVSVDTMCILCGSLRSGPAFITVRPAVVVVPTTDCELDFALSPVVDHAVSPQGEGGDPWKARGISHPLVPRIRTIKPEFWADEKLAPLAPIDRLVFLGLVSLADDAGRLVDNERKLNADIFPETGDDTHESLAKLASMGRIQRGLTASGQRVIQVVNWHHQKIDHPNMLAALPEIRELLASDSREPRENGANASRAARDSISTGTSDLRSVPTINDQNQDLRSHSRAPVSGNGSMHENGKQPAPPVPGAVPEQTALGETERVGASARGSKPLAAEGSSEALSTIHIPQEFTEYLSPKSVLCKDLGDSTSTNTGGVENGVVEGVEGSKGNVPAQASPISTVGTGDGTERHRVEAVVTNPVVESLTRQILPVPDTNSRQKLAGSQSSDAEALPPENPPAGLAEQSGAGVGGGKRAKRKPKDPLATDECWKWLVPYRDVWESVHGAGSFHHRIAGPYLGPLRRANGDEAVCANLRRYLEREEVRFQNLSRFAQHFAAYGPPAPPPEDRRLAANRAFDRLAKAVALRENFDFEPGELAGWKAVGGADGFRASTDKNRDRFARAYAEFHASLAAAS